MKTPDMSHLHIGEFSVKPDKNLKRATLSCDIPKRSRAILKLFDKYGFACQKKEYQLREGKNKLELDCTSLESGDYSAWIELDGKTYLRGFSIQESEKKKGFLERLKELLRLRQVDHLYY